MFNFVVNKALQVFTFRFAPDSARNENSGRSRILHHQNIFCFCHLTNSFQSLSAQHQGIRYPIFPSSWKKSKPIGLAWIETFNYLLETLTRKVLVQQILHFAFGCALRLKRSINGTIILVLHSYCLPLNLTEYERKSVSKHSYLFV